MWRIGLRCFLLTICHPYLSGQRGEHAQCHVLMQLDMLPGYLWGKKRNDVTQWQIKMAGERVGQGVRIPCDMKGS
jgi:hypothetical protein